MSRRLVALLTMTILALAGCSDASTEDGTPESAPGAQRIDSGDGSFTIDVPADWTSSVEKLTPRVVVVAQGTDPVDQLVISAYETAEQAEREAVFITTGLAGQGIVCERLEDSTVFGDKRLVFDCPQVFEGETSRRLFFPVVHEGRSVLVLLQTAGASLEETRPVVQPVLESLTWR